MDMNDIGCVVEHTVTGADGRPFDRFPAELTGVTPPTPSAADDSNALSYVLESDVPACCFPLTPDAGGTATFDLTVLKRVGRDDTADDVLPLGAVLGQITSAGNPAKAGGRAGRRIVGRASLVHHARFRRLRLALDWP